jgi:soluble lytic murein transglycosylase-like protein
MPKGVEQWRSMIASELNRSGYPLPPQLVEAVMYRESRGNVGAVNPSSGASGLMQVMPIALKDYNQNHQHKYTMAQLRGKTQSAARIQIRVGLWILARFWRGAFRYLKKRLGEVALDDLARIADFFYAAGPGNSRKKLDKINRPTYDAVKARYPNWDRIIPAQKVWDYVAAHGGTWNLQAVDNWLKGGVIIDNKKTAMGAAMGIIIIAVALWLMQKGKK